MTEALEGRQKGKIPLRRCIVIVVAIGIGVVGTRGIYVLSQTEDRPVEGISDNPPAPKVTEVTALGRLQPQGEVIQVSSSQPRAKIEQLLVRKGDRVKAGEIVAILENHATQKAAVETAKQEVEVAQANLEIVKAGAKQGEIAAQEATIARLEAELAGEKSRQSATIQRLNAELANARAEYNRYQSLTRQGAASEFDLDRFHLTLETARERLAEAQVNRDKTIATLKAEISEAKATLNRIEEVRPVDIRQAEAEVARAIALLEEAQAQLELTLVKAPSDGRILDIETYPGEAIPEEGGIVELGQTEQMLAIAEVYESDLSKVRVGQPVTLTSESGAFSGELRGKVSQIGWQIGKKDVLDTDPAASVDARVVEVEIQLDPESVERVQNLTYSQVIATIETE